MSASRYNLRSTCQDPCPSSQVSEETVDGFPAHVNVDASQMTQHIPEIDDVHAMGDEVDPLHVSEDPSHIVEDNETSNIEPTRSHHGIRHYGKVIQTDVLQDVIASLRVCKSTPPPPVPLCRLVVNESIRLVQKNISDLGYGFRMNGYLKELGTFLVSIKKANEPELEVSDLDLQEWGPIWRSINAGFEEEVLRSDEWSHLSNKKFIVWDGNHRVQAWMEKIREG